MITYRFKTPAGLFVDFEKNSFQEAESEYFKEYPAWHSWRLITGEPDRSEFG